MPQLNNFDSWLQSIKGSSHAPIGLVDAAVFVNDTLNLAKRIYDDLGLTDESLLLEIYDRLVEKLEQ
ncbi:hypothetical protein [Synechocystis sp. LKSZ1]|uniref:hypothetical protein n=1 Tax=Synechocystis sp. LKSZ1 TaxID=3144951 RepID=UPI00336BB664